VGEALFCPKSNILEKAKFTELAITSKHSIAAGALPHIHRDPFDRMMIAQAQTEKFLFATLDPIIAGYDVNIFQS
jgi:PIN domain nuclease of toxin-antitoxin system